MAGRAEYAVGEVDPGLGLEEDLGLLDPSAAGAVPKLTTTSSAPRGYDHANDRTT